MRRQQKEQAEKERVRLENERRREKEEEDALEKARYILFTLYVLLLTELFLSTNSTITLSNILCG